MKIAVIDTGLNDALSGEARAFLPKLLKGLTEKGDEVRLITNGAADEKAARELEDANAILHANLLSADGAVEENTQGLARFLNELKPDVYLIWASARIGWLVLPILDPNIATLAVGHADSEIFYAPARHYRSLLTRVVGATPETSVGFVISCVLDKERVEWISYDEAEASAENLTKTIETYRLCFEKAVSDAQSAPREPFRDFPPMKTSRPAWQSWFGKLKAKLTG